MTTGTSTRAPAALRPVDGLAHRALELVRAGTTEMADHMLEVPRSYYGDADQDRRERDEILATTPLPLLPTARVARPHDFAVRDVLGTSVLVTRNGAGQVRALLNYCRHRGARPAEGCGSARRFTCPYHAWTYDSAGTLVGLPGAEGFTGIDRGEHGLVELPCEERAGFVWVVLTAGAPLDLDAHLGPLADELAAFGFERYEFLAERTIDATVNWKAALEAFAESYHFPYVHARSILGSGVVPNTATFDSWFPHHRLGFPTPGIAEIVPLDPVTLHSMVLIYWIYPNMVLGVSPVGVELIDILPGEEPGTSFVRHGWMAERPAADDATRAGYRDLYDAVHAGVRDEDFAVLPGCGEGIRRGQHEHLLVGRNEPGVQNVVRAFSTALGLELG